MAKIGEVWEANDNPKRKWYVTDIEGDLCWVKSVDPEGGEIYGTLLGPVLESQCHRIDTEEEGQS